MTETKTTVRELIDKLQCLDKNKEIEIGYVKIKELSKNKICIDYDKYQNIYILYENN